MYAWCEPVKFKFQYGAHEHVPRTEFSERTQYVRTYVRVYYATQELDLVEDS